MSYKSGLFSTLSAERLACPAWSGDTGPRVSSKHKGTSACEGEAASHSLRTFILLQPPAQSARKEAAL